MHEGITIWIVGDVSTGNVGYKARMFEYLFWHDLENLWVSSGLYEIFYKRCNVSLMELAPQFVAALVDLHICKNDYKSNILQDLDCMVGLNGAGKELMENALIEKAQWLLAELIYKAKLYPHCKLVTSAK